MREPQTDYCNYCRLSQININYHKPACARWCEWFGIRTYDSIETLMNALKPGMIDPAVDMRNKLRLIKAQEQTTASLRDDPGKSL